MKWLVMAVVMIGGAVLQTFIPAYAILGQAKLPLLLALVLYYALRHETGCMLVAALLAGFLQDVLSPIPLGYSSFCFCIAGLIAGRFRNVVLLDSHLPPLLFGVAAGAGTTLALYLLLVKEQLIACTFWYLLLKIAGAGILGGLCTPLIFLLVGKLDGMVGNISMKEETVVLDIE